MHKHFSAFSVVLGRSKWYFFILYSIDVTVIVTYSLTFWIYSVSLMLLNFENLSVGFLEIIVSYFLYNLF